MSKSIDRQRLRDLRNRSGLSLEALADRMPGRLSAGTIHRIEKGLVKHSRQRTLDLLAKALGVEPGVLTGELSMPAAPKSGQDTPDALVSQMNIRVDGAVRNALLLTAQRYRIPMTRIIELAPLLFVLAAEGSLKRRHTKVAELQALADQQEEMCQAFPHLPNFVGRMSIRVQDALAAESKSIADRDILARELADDIWGGAEPMEPDLDEAERNPFVFFLKEAGATDSGVATISGFGRNYSDFTVCREDARELAGDDDALADAIVKGWVLLPDMPRELLGTEALDARKTWLRAKMDSYLDQFPGRDPTNLTLVDLGL